MTKSRKSAPQSRKAKAAVKVAQAPVVRIPGLNTEELALIDKAAGLDRRSRADWCRIQLLGVAAERVERSTTSWRPCCASLTGEPHVEGCRKPSRPIAGTISRPIRTPADAAEAVARRTGVKIATFEPDPQ